MVQETLTSYIDKVKRYGGFSIEEVRSLIICILAVGFMFSFRSWGDSSLDMTKGILNLLLCVIIAAIAIFSFVGMQRLHALRLGYKPEFRLFTWGLLGGILLCFITNGTVVIPFIGTTELHMINKHRLGHFRYGVNMVNIGLVSFTGPLTCLLVAYFFKIINIGLGSDFIKTLVLVNLYIAVIAMLPIPPLNPGARIWFWSRISYWFMLPVIVSAALLIWFSNNFFFIFFGSLFVGAIIYVIYYLVYEEESYGA